MTYQAKYRTAVALIAGLAVAALLAACDEKADANKPRFDPARATEMSRAALIEPRDLPGSGWTITSDETDASDSEDDAAADQFIQDEPACAEYSKMLQLFEGGPYDTEPVGAAQRELTREKPGSFLPTTVQVDVEVYGSVAEVSEPFDMFKDALGPQTQECLALFFADAISQELGDSGPRATAEPIPQASAPPREGIAMAFKFSVPVMPGFTLEGTFHMISWPYSNAAVTVLIVGPPEEVTSDLLSATLTAIESKVAKAASK